MPRLRSFGRATGYKRGSHADQPPRPFGISGVPMNERGFLVVAGFIALAIVADLVLNHGSFVLFLIRDLLRLVEYISFWR